MTTRTYPYKAWTLTPAFRPVEVELVAQSWPGSTKHDQWDQTAKGRRYDSTKLHATKDAAIAAGYASLDEKRKKLEKNAAPDRQTPRGAANMSAERDAIAAAKDALENAAAFIADAHIVEAQWSWDPVRLANSAIAKINALPDPTPEGCGSPAALAAAVPAPRAGWISLTEEEQGQAFRKLDGGVDGFLKLWGWKHFAYVIEQMCREKNGAERTPAVVAALRDCVAVMERELKGLAVIQPELAQAKAALAATSHPTPKE